MKIPQTEVIATREGQEIYREILPPGEYAIGRELGIKIWLKSDRISCRHAKLELNYFDWLIEDLGSTNGTFVGGPRIQPSEPTLIFPQQEVRVADVLLHLRRLRIEDATGSLAPQTEAVLRYLPAEIRGERKYRIKGVIAIGGMGVILEAEDAGARRSVAMKLLRNVTSPEHVARFVEEAQITAQLEHPNIVPLYELSVNELDAPFFVMKLVHGESVQRVLNALDQKRPIAVAHYPLSALLNIFLRVCDAVGFAHSKGVVHRDLKPDNLMLGDFGEVLVMDWGLAKTLGKTAHPYPDVQDARIRTMVNSTRQTDSTGVGTLPGTVLGTEQFMSPEQAAGRSHAVDARADVYALGAILFNLLTLRPPIDGADPSEILDKVKAGKITAANEALGDRKLPHLPNGRPPSELVEIAMKAMELDPNDRYPTARALQTQVHDYLLGEKN